MAAVATAAGHVRQPQDVDTPSLLPASPVLLDSQSSAAAGSDASVLGASRKRAFEPSSDEHTATSLLAKKCKSNDVFARFKRKITPAPDEQHAGSTFAIGTFTMRGSQRPSRVAACMHCDWTLSAYSVDKLIQHGKKHSLAGSAVPAACSVLVLAPPATSTTPAVSAATDTAPLTEESASTAESFATRLHVNEQQPIQASSSHNVDPGEIKHIKVPFMADPIVQVCIS